LTASADNPAMEFILNIYSRCRFFSDLVRDGKDSSFGGGNGLLGTAKSN
jgi:hypothetical protein